jgi:DNA replication protein DnaC
MSLRNEPTDRPSVGAAARRRAKRANAASARLRTRCERHATLITSNRTAPETGELFGDPLLASAAMDRLLHDAHVLILDGASFRNPGERRKFKKNNQPEVSP